MLKKLKRKLYLIFITSLVTIFFIAFTLLLLENVKSKKTSDLLSFNRTGTLLLLQLERQTDYESTLRPYEEKRDFLFCLMRTPSDILYQSPGQESAEIFELFLQDRSDILFFPDEESSGSESSDDESLASSVQGGTYEIKNRQGQKYFCTFCLIRNDRTAPYTLLLARKQPSFASLIQPELPFYLEILSCVIIAFFLLSRILIEKAMKPTQAAIQSQRNFIAAVSHECKTPLAAILSSAEMTSALPDLPETAKRQLTIIDAEVSRMSRMVQDLLLLSSLDAGHWSLRLEEINVDTLLIDLYTKFEPLCAGKQLVLRLDMAEETYPTLYSDQERLHQILSIFLDNAVSYSPASAEIVLGAAVDKGLLLLTVTDHGCGIPDEEKPYIFDRFYRCDKSRTQKEHFGLGLSIAKELIDRLGGKVTLSDTEGGGCTFRLALSFPG